MASKQPATATAKPTPKLPRQPSAQLTPLSPATPTKAKAPPKPPSLKLPSSTKKVSSPRNPPSTPATPLANTTTTTKLNGNTTFNTKIPTTPASLKRPTPILNKSPSTSPTYSSRFVVEDDLSKKYKDMALVNVSFQNFILQVLGLETNSEQDKEVQEKFLDAFQDMDDTSSPSAWPLRLDSLKRKISEPRELYTKQIQKMQEQVHSQVFVMNEKLVTEQESKEQLALEVAMLRKQVALLEGQGQGYTLLRRSLHINLQAAMDHILVTTKLLTSGPEADDVEDEHFAYGKPDTPVEITPRPKSVTPTLDTRSAERPPSQTHSEAYSTEDSTQDGERQDKVVERHDDEDRHGVADESETEQEEKHDAENGQIYSLDSFGNFDMQPREQNGNAPSVDGGGGGDEDGFEFFV